MIQQQTQQQTKPKSFIGRQIFITREVVDGLLILRRGELLTIVGDDYNGGGWDLEHNCSKCTLSYARMLVRSNYARLLQEGSP